MSFFLCVVSLFEYASSVFFVYRFFRVSPVLYGSTAVLGSLFGVSTGSARCSMVPPRPRTPGAVFQMVHPSSIHPSINPSAIRSSSFHHPSITRPYDGTHEGPGGSPFQVFPEWFQNEPENKARVRFSRAGKFYVLYVCFLPSVASHVYLRAPS